MSASYNKTWAFKAAHFAQVNLSKGSANNADKGCGLEDSDLSVKLQLEWTRRKSANLTRQPGALNYISLTASVAMQDKVGNCGELCFVAAMFLYNSGIYEWDLIHLLPPGDHMFVVLGRDASTDPKDINSWNEDAFICDPWLGNVAAPSEYKTALISTFRYHDMGLYVRCNGVKNFTDAIGKEIEDNGPVITKKKN